MGVYRTFQGSSGGGTPNPFGGTGETPQKGGAVQVDILVDNSQRPFGAKEEEY